MADYIPLLSVLFEAFIFCMVLWYYKNKQKKTLEEVFEVLKIEVKESVKFEKMYCEIRNNVNSIAKSIKNNFKKRGL